MLAAAKRRVRLFFKRLDWYLRPVVTRIVFLRRIVRKVLSVKLYKNPSSVETALLNVDRRTDMTGFTGAFTTMQTRLKMFNACVLQWLRTLNSYIYLKHIDYVSFALPLFRRCSVYWNRVKLHLFLEIVTENLLFGIKSRMNCVNLIFQVRIFPGATEKGKLFF